MTNTTKLPLLIFDLDGTLIDSAPDIHRALNQMLTTYNRPSVDLATLTSHIGDGLTKLVHDFFPEYQYKSKENYQKVDEFLNIYRDEYLTHSTRLYNGVESFLKSYKGPKAIVTNKAIKPTMQIFNHFKLDNYDWVEVLGGDSLPECKPSALPLLKVMEKVSYSSSETWMIGDGRPDMQAAQNAKCNKIAVHYGYSKPEELSLFHPDRILHKFSDLDDIFNK